MILVTVYQDRTDNKLRKERCEFKNGVMTDRLNPSGIFFSISNTVSLSLLLFASLQTLT